MKNQKDSTVLLADEGAILIDRNRLSGNENEEQSQRLRAHRVNKSAAAGKHVLTFGLKTLIGLLVISPLLIGICFSFQKESELAVYPLKFLTSSPTPENYLEVFRKLPLLTYLKNSGIVCLIAIAAQIVISCMAAYGFVYFEFPGKKLLFSLVLMTTMIPGEVVVITNYTTIQSLHLTNSYAGLVLPSLISGTAIFLMRQFFMTLPITRKRQHWTDAGSWHFCGGLPYRWQCRRSHPLRYICL